MAQNQSLSSGDIRSQIRSIAVPASIGFFFHTMYNVVDSIFAGRLSTEALAAMGLSFPIFFFIVALAPGFGTAVSAIVGNSLGSNDTRQAERESQQSIGFGVFISMLLMVIGIFFSRPLIQFIGGEGEVLNLAVEYTSVIYWGALAFILFYFSNSILTAHGDSKPFRNMLILGFFLNLILNPWFIYGGFGVEAMGFKGIGLSTVIIQFFTGIYLFGLCLKRGYFGAFRLKHFLPRKDFIKDALIQGVPASLNMLMIAIGFFVTNYFIQGYGEATIAMFGVTTRIEQIILLPTIGISIAVGAIIAQSNGAKDQKRIKETLAIGTRWGMYIIIPASVLMAVAGSWWMGIFSDDAEVVSLGKTYLWIMLWTEWSYVLGGLYIGALQAMKKPALGFLVPLYRTVFARIVLFYLCVTVWQLGQEYVWWSIVLINLTAMPVIIWYANREIAKVG